MPTSAQLLRICFHINMGSQLAFAACMTAFVAYATKRVDDDDGDEVAETYDSHLRQRLQEMVCQATAGSGRRPNVLARNVKTET